MPTNQLRYVITATVAFVVMLFTGAVYAHAAVAEEQAAACEMNTCNPQQGSCQMADVRYSCDLKNGGGCQSVACGA